MVVSFFNLKLLITVLSVYFYTIEVLGETLYHQRSKASFRTEKRFPKERSGSDDFASSPLAHDRSIPSRRVVTVYAAASEKTPKDQSISFGRLTPKDPIDQKVCDAS